jgi:hypothetical protein
MHYANTLECMFAQEAVLQQVEEETVSVTASDVSALDGVREEPAVTEATLEEAGDGVGTFPFNSKVTLVNLWRHKTLRMVGSEKHKCEWATSNSTGATCFIDRQFNQSIQLQCN